MGIRRATCLLLKEHVRLRSTDPRFIAKVRTYFSVLLPKLVPLQVTHGGPVIMMQVENEYGSYGMEKEYLRQTKQVMENLASMFRYLRQMVLGKKCWMWAH